MGLENRIKDIYDLDCVFNQPMKKKTSLGVGGNAKYFASPKSLFALTSAVKAARECKTAYKIIGFGTNLLVSDKGFDGIIITTADLSDVFLKQDKVFATCGASLKKLADFAASNSLSGLEKLSGIPATVGGAIYQNAGAFGVSVSDFISDVQTIKSGKIRNRRAESCAFGYRKSVFGSNKEIIVSATFALNRGDFQTIKERSEFYADKRKALQPQGRSCGSVFLNGDDYKAGKLIEEAGLKGFFIGGASISDKHANFISVNSAATAKDVYLLIKHVKNTIKEKFGVQLKEEVEFVGDFI